MVQKATHLKRATKNQRGRDAVWARIRELSRQGDGTFTTKDIEDVTRDAFDTIRNYVAGLTHAGYLECLTPERRKKEPYPEGRWKLIKDVGVDRPMIDRHGQPVKEPLGRSQMWRTMKIIGTFDKHDLAIAASTDEHVIKTSEAGYYIRYLYKAGYLSLVNQSTTRQAAKYRMIKTKNTGPRSPMIQKVTQVFDPNTGEVVWTAEGNEE